MSYLPDFPVLLKNGSRVVRDGVEHVIEDRLVGVVTAPSGQIVGCDPLTDAREVSPFIVTVPPGRYELRAWIASLHDGVSGTDIRTVALQLVVREQPTMRWELESALWLIWWPCEH
ncbi:DUF4241 domain-containing protein [Paractinoplanes rhizophilus]|uniref:DUF4241 domain-containing protein n=1 Tax=Paractinoplanes rhizophilus TaxID=1416877 RepID=A0ABW2HPE3_9ACTN